METPVWTFDDIILSPATKDEIDIAVATEKYKSLIYETWKLGTVIKQKRGMSLNFYGESGTGKTITAHAIANQMKLNVLMVDYAEIESKYVGETSKNLVKLFEFAKENHALIVFDEADALLSKRVTSMNNATDVSVNQTRNVLLKILDSYEQPIIFTTNFIQNYDGAFFRRISKHIKFELPNKEARQRLWEHYLIGTLPLKGDRKEVIDRVTEFENITGADISNIVLESAIDCARGKSEAISIEMLTKKICALNEFKLNAFGGQVTTSKISKEEAENILGGNLHG